MDEEYFLGIITHDELQEVNKAGEGDLPHPLAEIAPVSSMPDVAVPSSTSDQVRANTERAARGVLQHNSHWMIGLKRRLLDTSDRTNSSSALGEIRAYGALLETGMTVAANSGSFLPTEGLSVDAGDGPVIIEVQSKQLDKDQVKAIQEQKRQHAAKVEAAVQRRRETGSNEVIAVSGPALVVMPLGAPNPAKSGDSVLTNAISRMTSTKSGEEQSDPEKPFVLWLDLQDPTVWGLPIPDEQLVPLYSELQDGKVGAGALWFSLYGRKDDPMLGMQSLDYDTVDMLHNGKFALSDRVSAVIYSMPRATVLMEHPSPARPIPPAFRASLLKLPFFQLDRSICEWEPGLVNARINLEHRTVAAAAKALKEYSQELYGGPAEHGKL